MIIVMIWTDCERTTASELNSIRSRSVYDQQAALEELKAEYVTQIEDANSRLQLHKLTMARNAELQATVQNLECDKSNLDLAKAAVDNGLRDL
jgi:hypothetical protein